MSRDERSYDGRADDNGRAVSRVKRSYAWNFFRQGEKRGLFWEAFCNACEKEGIEGTPVTGRPETMINHLKNCPHVSEETKQTLTPNSLRLYKRKPEDLAREMRGEGMDAGGDMTAPFKKQIYSKSMEEMEHEREMLRMKQEHEIRMQREKAEAELRMEEARKEWVISLVESLNKRDRE